GSSTRRIKCLILYVLGLWCNAVDGAKDKQFRSSYKICGPNTIPKGWSNAGNQPGLSQWPGKPGTGENRL
ncbi:MAG: hypothetical protein PF503_22120, partial [Desulfobacula sp.]|nr:hypothetical protein [Desulfobacula sp.]